MTDYNTLLERLYQVSLFRGVKLGLEHVSELCALLDSPEKTFPTIHIAGSNGKGSVSFKIAKSLEYSGLKVGLYTSPHLSSFRERIAINGALISEESVQEGLQRLFSLFDREKKEPTFFEIVTLLAFDFFHKEQVDIAVIETGLGGALDATNVITPILSVITSISLEHTAILGTTREAIGREKAGIIKPGVPVVLGPQAHLKEIVQRASTVDAPLFLAPSVQGFYDLQNRAIAQAALSLLPYPVQERALDQRPACRFEEVKKGIILDVAHNPDAFVHLLQACDFHYPHSHIRLVLGLSADKDLARCLALVSSRALWIHLVEAENPRAAPTQALAQLLDKGGYSHFSTHVSVADGLASAIAQRKEDQEKIIVCGSFYIMDKARRHLGIETVARDVVELNEKRL